jgi:hypothetical protein
MNRAELERLSRDALIERAEAAGVTRARILTRPELVDELLLRSTSDDAARARARGLFGLARDLVARVVERGLHLPDAAERIRSLGSQEPAQHGAPAALPTVTLAEIYAAQGHRDRAVQTLRGVLSREPDHAAARALLTQLEDATYPVPPPRLPPESEDASLLGSSSTENHVGPGVPSSRDEAERVDGPRARSGGEASPSEPAHVLDDAPLPPRYDVDECVAIPVDPRTLYVYWEVRQRTLDYLRSTRPDGTISLRLVIVVPTWDGPQTGVRDHDVGIALGDHFAESLSPGSVVRVAIGWKHGAAFVPIAHSPALETPPGGPSPLVADVLVRWTPEGLAPVRPEDRDAAGIDRALGRVRREAARVWAGREGVAIERPLGASEKWAGPPGS